MNIGCVVLHKFSCLRSSNVDILLFLSIERPVKFFSVITTGEKMKRIFGLIAE